MSWGEAVRLTRTLLKDPSSHVMAAVYAWDAPVSREWLILADVFDVLQIANWQRSGGKRSSPPKPYKRPYADPNRKRRGRTNKSRAEVISILNAHGHSIGGD